MPKIAELLKDIDYAMLSTVDAAGNIHSRPMGALEVDLENESLWFFAKDDALSSREIEYESHVNVSYSRPDQQRYVSVSGRATIVRESRKMEKLWKPSLRQWFQDGLNDPHIVLIQVHIDKFEYWDPRAGQMMELKESQEAGLYDDDDDSTVGRLVGSDMAWRVF